MSLVNLSTLKECYAHTAGRVTYLLGAKPALGSDSASFDTADCSGWVRWALDRAGLRLPDGSQTQWSYCRDVLKLRQIDPYSNVDYAAADPSRLFIAFESAARTGIGHVWLINAGRTLECSSHRGVNSQPWQNREAIAIACYEIPCG